MITVVRSDFQEGLMRLGQLSVQFWQRTVLLSVTGTESCGMRFQRLQTHCRERAWSDFFRLTKWKPGSRLTSDMPEDLMTACSDAYMEEVRNTEQVALITYEEMWVWLESFVEEWRNLANATLK